MMYAYHSAWNVKRAQYMLVVTEKILDFSRMPRSVLGSALGAVRYRW